MRLREFLEKPRTLFVGRNLLNPKDIVEWAKSQGLPHCLPDNEFHVTIAFSKEKVNWDLTSPEEDTLRISAGPRHLDMLGAKENILVLRFESDTLTTRWKELIDDVGCSWDYPDFKIHMTISYDPPKGIDVKSMKPYEGPLIFGPEIFNEINNNYTEKFKEQNLELTDTKS